MTSQPGGYFAVQFFCWFVLSGGFRKNYLTDYQETWWKEDIWDESITFWCTSWSGDRSTIFLPNKNLDLVNLNVVSFWDFGRFMEYHSSFNSWCCKITWQALYRHLTCSFCLPHAIIPSDLLSLYMVGSRQQVDLSKTGLSVLRRACVLKVRVPHLDRPVVHLTLPPEPEDLTLTGKNTPCSDFLFLCPSPTETADSALCVIT